MSNTKFNKLIKFPENKTANDILDTIYLENISTLNSYAFANNMNLKKIYIPSAVVEIGEYVFDGSDNLSAFFERDKANSPFLSTRFFNSNDQSRIFYLSSDLYYDTSADNIKIKYRINSDLTSVTVTGLSVNLDDETILSNFDLDIPESINEMKVTSIGRSAFSNKYLRSVTLSNATSLKKIEAYAFNSLSLVNVQNFILPASVSDIESQGLARLSNVSDMFFKTDDTLTGQTNNSYYVLSSNLSNIAHDAFYGCPNMTHFYLLPSGIDINGLSDIANPGTIFMTDKYAFATYFKTNNQPYSDTFSKVFSYILEKQDNNFIIHTTGDSLSTVDVSTVPAKYIMMPYSLLSNYGNFIGIGETAFALNNYQGVVKFFNDDDSANISSAVDYISNLSYIKGGSFFASNIMDIRFGNSDADITCINNQNLRQYFSYINKGTSPANGIETRRYSIYYPTGNTDTSWTDTNQKGELIWFSPNSPGISDVIINNSDLISDLSDPTINTQQSTNFKINATRLSAFGEYAFSGNNNIVNITISDDFTDFGEIKNFAFSSVDSLTSFNVGSHFPNLSVLGSHAFYWCKKISEIDLSETNITEINSHTFLSCPELTAIHLPEISVIHNTNTFRSLPKLNNLTFTQNSVFTTAEISELEINGCKFLMKKDTDTQYHIYSLLRGTFDATTQFQLDFSKIDSSKNVLLEQYAFVDMSKLSCVHTRSNLSVGDHGFYSNSDLLSVYIANGTYLEGDAFSKCPNIEFLTIEDNIYFKDYQCDEYSNLETFSQIFANNNFKNLKDLNLSGNSSIKYIPQYFCENNSSLSSVSLPESTIYIDSNAFLNCTGISSITIPSSVNYIASTAFDGCTSLAVLNIDLTQEEALEKIPNFLLKFGTLNEDTGEFTIKEGVTINFKQDDITSDNSN